MKSVNAAVLNAIRSAYDVTAVPKLTVEWNWNRYADEVTADNTPLEDDEGYDIEAFPIDSIIKPNRPTAGILKARVGEARVADPYSGYNGTTRAARYYIGSVEDTYKYWTSPYPTDGTGAFPLHTDSITTVRPSVNYPDGVKTNRIVVGFEDTFAKPEDFTVRVQTTFEGAWTTVSTNPTINTKGQVILNWNTTWSSGNTPSENTATMPIIYGIQVRVDSMQGVSGGSPDGVGVHLNLIEISARRVHDLSSRLINANDNFDMSDKSLVYPIGTVTSNTASLELFNGDGELNAENPDSAFAGLIEPNAVFTLDWVYTVDDVDYTVPQFKMFGGAWAGQRAEQVNVECTDYSKYFQETKPRASMYLNKTVGQIVWQICDSVGFVDYEIQSDDVTTDKKIPVWFTDGTETVWELFDELAKATQTAIYFDGYGKLQVRTRTNAFNPDATTAWTLRGDDDGTDLADIISIDQSDELESNFIKVTYSQTDIDPVVNGQSKTQVLWEPEGTVALRACPLYRDLAVDSEFIFLPPAEAKIWPFEGMVNIQGELIKYKGKKFVYYEAGVRKTAVVNSKEEMEKFNTITAFASRYKNHYTGELKATERGVWNSENKVHTVEATGYSVRNIINGTRTVGVNGFTHRKAESRVYLNAGYRYKDLDDLLVATRGSDLDSGFYYYGVKMRFEKQGGKHQRAGLLFHNNTNNEDGYYIELVPTKKLSSGKTRAKHNEVALYSRNGGNWKRHGKGTAFHILEGIDYEIDVQFKVVGSDHRISVWVNGKKAFTQTVSGADKNTFGGKFGLYLRGDTKASYEYLYAIAREETDDPSDDFSYLDKIDGGYTGGQLDREWVYRWRTQRRRIKKKWTKVTSRYNISFFDEFGPIVHEVREFNVKFETAPAISSRLYMGNDYTVCVPEYRADSFNARFYVANASRRTAIAHGEDTMQYAGSSATINPIMAVIGRSIKVKESENVEVKNETQIRKRGEIQTEISSQWIQSKDMAQEIADWIAAHWSKGADEQQVTIFGNPLIELGDVVEIEYPQIDMAGATHKYFVVGVQNSFDSGLETTLVLRRVVV